MEIEEENEERTCPS